MFLCVFGGCRGDRERDRHTEREGKRERERDLLVMCHQWSQLYEKACNL